MAQHITTASAAVVAGNNQAIFIQVNATLTGTLTVTNAGSTYYGSSSGTIAVITNPTVGSQFKYGGLQQQGAISITPSTTCDITVSSIDHLT